MGGVAGQVQPAVLHRLADEAAQWDDDFMEDRPSFGRSPRGTTPQAELLPDPLVGPVVDLVGGVALEVQALDFGRARADQREATSWGIDQFVGGGGASARMPNQPNG